MGTHESDYRPGEGWIAVRRDMMMMVGLMNSIFGIAAIDQSSFFTDEGRYVLFDDLQTWGWIMLIVGIVQIGAAYSIWSGHRSAASSASRPPASAWW